MRTEQATRPADRAVGAAVAVRARHRLESRIGLDGVDQGERLACEAVERLGCSAGAQLDIMGEVVPHELDALRLAREVALDADLVERQLACPRGSS